MLNANSNKPLFIQIAEWVEKEIITERLKPGDRVYSQNELAVFFSVNAITAAKGIDVLERNGVVEKRRGIGMFVTENALAQIVNSSKSEVLVEIIDDMWNEADKLALTQDELFKLIESRRHNGIDKK